jgi:uncharacterized phage protein (possible DNA packaging)
MIVTLDEMKNFLRVDFNDDDPLITTLIEQSQNLCKDILRVDSDTDLICASNAKTAVMYAVSYIYEHREEADYLDLTLTLRSLLFGDRKPGF